MSWKPTCYVCGTDEILPDADLRNPTCAAHAEARKHLVSMTVEAGVGGLVAFSVATCRCGHREQMPWGGHHDAMNAAVKAHWRAVCGETA